MKKSERFCRLVRLYNRGVKNYEKKNFFIKSDGKGGYIPLFCRHCQDAGCVNACMSGALTKDPETGLVKYDRTKCAGCYMCVMNCKFGIPQPDVSLHYMVKCDFCEGISDTPSCVKACPTGAIYVKEV